MLFGIHSCRKDSKNDFNDVIDSEVQQAMAWYSGVNPLSVNAASNKLVVKSTTPTQGVDLSQYISPDWHHTTKYTRFNKSVIEMPVDPARQFKSAFTDPRINKTYSSKYSKSSYLILKDGTGYQAFIMTIIADSAYVNNDLNKLNLNTYSKRDKNFSGKVLYFTAKGQYVSGYAYKNGQLILPPGYSAPIKSVQNVTVNGIKVTGQQTSCTAWYLITEINGVVVSQVYLYTDCTTVDTGTGDNGGGGGNGRGGNGPSIPCPMAQGTTNVNIVHVTDNGDQTPSDGFSDGDGGFPPPVYPVSSPCVVATTITNNLNDPCLYAVLEKMRNGDLTGRMASIVNDVFDNSDKFNLNFIEFSDNSNTAVPAKSDNPSKSGGIYNETIEINTAITNGAAQEFDPVIMMHEVLHSYMNANNKFYMNQFKQHQEMFDKYVGDMKLLLQQLYTISDPDAYSLILNGMSDIFGHDLDNYENMLRSKYNVADDKYEFYRAGLNGTKCN